ncbi:MAG: relaxase/mobilization nuclease domain-containing protein [Methylotenera sp.]|nr:relaxase/mobilization nuclease domain-containing protein [Methylotenera sp.]
MLPIIPDQRKSTVTLSKQFNDLVAYCQNSQQTEKLYAVSQTQKFGDILNYTTQQQDRRSNVEKCIAVRTHGVLDISTATMEMNAVAAKNTRCKAPAFHFILTWPEHEYPDPADIFDAAEHAIKTLKLAEHQYVLAVHIDTDNIHCHVAVNRIHPKTFKSRNIEWAKKTLHLAARQSELKHGWTHDNGIYIVETSANGQKSIVLNSNIVSSANAKQDYAQSHQGINNTLPAWHDPDSLSAWIKTDVSIALKQVLPKLYDWNALHGWLARHHITLTDSGGGGMRIHATSAVTGEVVDLPASKGLRCLKRTELEVRWGRYSQGALEPNPYIPSYQSDRIELDETNDTVSVAAIRHIQPDRPHLTPLQLERGAIKFLKQYERSFPPNREMLNVYDEPDRLIPASHRRGDLQEIESSPRSLSRDDAKREARKWERAAARLDLRSRYAQYQRFVREGDTEYSLHSKAIREDRGWALKALYEATNLEKRAVRKNQTLPQVERFLEIVSIFTESTQLKLQINADFQAQKAALKATRPPPLGWRTWLHEQANLGDQAALSALRGIVYQAQRDAKYRSEIAHDAEETIELEEITQENRARKFNQLMARLLDEEQKEVAIRSARASDMRPYEADALLAKYVGIQWRVTGNGNVAYSDSNASHLFTDRGNRITFDRALVSDEDILLALVHAQNKFGKQLTLTGQDSVFSERMARLADDMGMAILNPELQITIENHRHAKALQIIETAAQTSVMTHDPAQQEDMLQVSAAMVAQPILPQGQTADDHLRAKVLSIDPYAQFIIPDIADNKRVYTGLIVATINQNETTQSGFAQHIGRGLYVLHPIDAPGDSNMGDIKVKYDNGQALATILKKVKVKGRNE